VDADSIDLTKPIKKHHLFDFGYETFEKLHDQVSRVRLMLSTNIEKHFPLKLSYDVVPMNRDIGVIWAALILIFLYVLIIWEIVHRTFAAMVASTLSIAVLAALGDRPTMAEIVSYIDVETILLLFSMMILVAILTQTGIFDYLAVWVYKVQNEIRYQLGLRLTKCSLISDYKWKDLVVDTLFVYFYNTHILVFR
jgi:P protein